ncbi:hypothetical protein MD484_g5000, partial [Candolleomyces efflorescens]
MGNICCWPRPGKVMDRAPMDAAQLHQEGTSAWLRYIDNGHHSSDLAETIEKCNEALLMHAAEKKHHDTQRNQTLLTLIFALLEQNLDRPLVEKIEGHFSELEGWSDLEKVHAHAIAGRLASGYHELYNRAPSDASLQHCLSLYTKAIKYSETIKDWTELNLKMAALYRQAGHLGEAMEVIKKAKAICPADRLDLLSSISVTKFLLHRDIYKSTESNQELENAVIEGEAALRVQFDMPPSQRATLLTGVAQSICTLSEARPPGAELKGKGREAILYARESVGMSVGNQLIEARIVLADALSSRRVDPTIQELDEAISLYRKARSSEALRGDQELLANLANSTCFRCETGGEVPEHGTTFQSAVDLYQEALAASSDNRWNSRIANNIACIYLGKANNTEAEVDYENARNNYLKAASYLEVVETEFGDLGDANDVGYYRDQAEAIARTINRLREGVRDASPRHPSERKPTPKRRSTARGSLN